MITSDKLGDMLIRIKNGYMAKKPTISLPHSKQRESVLKILAKNSFITKYTVTEEDNKKYLNIELSKLITKQDFTVRRISKPGRRIYIKAKTIYKVKGGKGILILSTPKGLIDDRQAKKQKLGGELIAEIF